MIETTKRYGLLVLGHTCLLLGVMGLFLPILPTTPFILIASFCYARSSEKFQTLLHENKYFGPPLRDWEQNKSISIRAKTAAVVTIVVGISVSLCVIPILAVKVGLVIVGILVTTFIVTRRSPPQQ